MKFNYRHRLIFWLINRVASFVEVKNRFVILTYHRVLDNDAINYPGDIAVEQFEMQMSMLSNYFNVVHLDKAISQLDGQSLGRRTICVTFDDGYKDNLVNAAPILKKYSIPGIVFIATGYTSGNCMWNDIIIEAIKNTSKDELELEKFGLGNYKLGSLEGRINTVSELLNKVKYLDEDEREKYALLVNNECETEIPRNLMMNESEISQLQAFDMKIGGHTVTHPILTKVSLQGATEEIVSGKEDLFKITHREADVFAYPNGRKNTDYTDEHVDIVKNAGFDMAVATNPGFVIISSDRFQLPRIVTWHKTKLKFFLFMIILFIKNKL